MGFFAMVVSMLLGIFFIVLGIFRYDSAKAEMERLAA